MSANNVSFTRIQNYHETMWIEALVEIDPKGDISYHSPAFCFNTSLGVIVSWDNPRFIFDDLKPYLDRWIVRRLTDDDIKDDRYQEMIPLLTQEWVEEAIDIINDAIKIGWHKLKK